jgi:hypothetical protein
VTYGSGERKRCLKKRSGINREKKENKKEGKKKRKTQKKLPKVFSKLAKQERFFKRVSGHPAGPRSFQIESHEV